MSMGPWNTGAPQREDMPRKPIDIKPTDYPVIWKRGLRTLFPLPAGTGLGRAQVMGQGTGPYTVVYRKSVNCLTCDISHILYA